MNEESSSDEFDFGDGESNANKPTGRNGDERFTPAIKFNSIQKDGRKNKLDKVSKLKLKLRDSEGKIKHSGLIDQAENSH
jgi:hypothetical protein